MDPPGLIDSVEATSGIADQWGTADPEARYIRGVVVDLLPLEWHCTVEKVHGRNRYLRSMGTTDVPVDPDTKIGGSRVLLEKWAGTKKGSTSRILPSLSFCTVHCTLARIQLKLCGSALTA